MPRSMLSFDRGTPIAHCLDSKGNKILTLHITNEEKDPDIVVDKIEQIIDDRDFEIVIKNMKLVPMEVKMIKKALISGKAEDISKLNDRLMLAINMLKELAAKKLKTEISFEGSNEISRIVPLIGAKNVPFDRSIFLCGPSGAGKSFLAKEIMKHDEKNRPIIIFSKIDNDDSLKDLKNLKIGKSSFSNQRDGGSRMIKIRLQTEADLLDLPCNEELKNCVCLFDDIDSFPKDIADFLNAYRDSLLECGRHHNITILSTSHMLYNWTKTRTVLNESELCCMFPHSNRLNSVKFLRDRMGLNKAEVTRILKQTMDAGRSLICKMSAPNIIMHEKGVFLI